MALIAAGGFGWFQSARPRVRTRPGSIASITVAGRVSIRAPSGEDATRVSCRCAGGGCFNPRALG